MYKDRGIIKWAPFDALSGLNEMVLGLINKKGKRDKPILSEDKLNELDLILKDAIRDNNEIMIDYYLDGYIKTTYGVIKKIDEIEKLIHLNTNEKLSVNDIVDMELLKNN